MENFGALITGLRKMPSETEWVEFKHNNYRPDMIGEDVSALANGAALLDKPFAYMVWGVHDKTHEVVGTDVTPKSLLVGKQEFENWLRSLLSDNAEFDIYETVYEEKVVAIIKIAKAVSRPVSFKKMEYVRVGSYTKKLSEVPSRQAQLWEKLRQSRFENGVAEFDVRSDEVVSKLDTQAFFDNLGRKYPGTADGVLEYLALEHLIELQDDGLYSILNSGAILFAKRLSMFPRVKRKAIRVIRYYGEDRLASSKEEEIDAGYAVDFEGLIRLVKAMIPSEEVIGSALREERNSYPSIAIREIVANALIHQDFSVVGAGPMIEIFNHHIEVTNPGSPMVNLDRIIDAPPCSRNEDIAALMRRMRVCEEKGTGWDKIALSCEMSELPAPRIRRYETGTRVIIYAKREFANLSNDDREWACYMHACLRFVNNVEYMSNSSLRMRFGLGTGAQSTISKLIKKTMEAGLIRPLDATAAPRYMRYVPWWA